MAADGAGGVFVTGEFSAGATLMGTKLNVTTGTGIFVASFDAAGKMRWLQQSEGAKSGNAYSAAFDGKSALFIGGAFTGPVSFGKIKVGATDGADLYGAKILVP